MATPQEVEADFVKRAADKQDPQEFMRLQPELAAQYGLTPVQQEPSQAAPAGPQQDAEPPSGTVEQPPELDPIELLTKLANGLGLGDPTKEMSDEDLSKIEPIITGLTKHFSREKK